VTYQGGTRQQLDEVENAEGIAIPRCYVTEKTSPEPRNGRKGFFPEQQTLPDPGLENLSASSHWRCRLQVSLKDLFAVKDEGYRAVIDQVHFHHLLKNPGGHGNPVPAKPRNKVFIERPCQVRLGRTDKRGPPAFPGISPQGELRHHECRSPCFEQRSVHETPVIGENPQVCHLFGEVVAVFFRIILSHSQKDKETRSDGTSGSPLDFNPRLFYPLQNSSHLKTPPIRIHRKYTYVKPMKTKKKPRTLVLVNPWIYDFAAYDLWSKPLGLLYLAGYLRQHGFDIHLIDCLDIHFPGVQASSLFKTPVRRRFGTGKFFREQIAKPPQLKDIDRPYSRYGIPRALFARALSQIKKPAAFLVTSLMTYWYPGVLEAIQMIRESHPGVPIVLGGIYARLCQQHARLHSGASSVITESAPVSVLAALHSLGIHPPGENVNSLPLPYPAFDLLGSNDYVCLLTSSGCPFRCKYCVSHFLNPVLTRRDPQEVFEEILYWHRQFGITDFAFYDDALLISADTHIRPILEKVLENNLPVRFHTPNALHIREITEDIARLLKQTGFRTIRLGYETADPDLHRRFDNKVSTGDFERAVTNLRKAGFTRQETGAYILAGLPGQAVDSVAETVDLAVRTRATPYLAEYSPIPHSDLWEAAVQSSSYDLEAEPLYHNNTLLPCWSPEQKNGFQQLRKRVIQIRRNPPDS
jgi:hypothetical protein